MATSHGYTKLGSPIPEECSPKPGGTLCPSHMMCIPNQEEPFALNHHHPCRHHCVCDRFLGFRGPECRKETRATWLLAGFATVIFFWAIWALVSNIRLLFELKEAGRLKANSIGRTMFFNTMGTAPVMGLALGVVGTTLGLDPHMTLYHIGGEVTITAMFFFYIISALTVSVVWIIDIQKTSSAFGVGIESARLQKRQELVYLTIAYVISLSCSALVIIANNSLVLVSIIGIFFNSFVGFSYQYAGRRVIRYLAIVEVGTSTRHVDIAQISNNIRIMSDSMTRLMIVCSLSFVGLGLTHPSGTPVYAAQNSLPRVFQGQFAYLAINACFLGVNQQIVEYIRYGSRKRHRKPQHPVVRFVRWLLCLPHCAHPQQDSSMVAPTPNTNSAAKGSRFGDRSRRRDRENRPPSSSDGSSSVSSGWFDDSDNDSSLSSSAVEGQENVWLISQKFQNPLAGGGEIVKVHLGNPQQGIVDSYFLSVPAAGARPMVPMVLAALKSEGSDGRRVRGRVVMDVGDGVLMNLYSDEVSVEDFEGLAEGSHAFVRCFGERHVRCTWHAFDFGFAEGHSLLARSNMVLMAGEVEVNAQGLVTRWLIERESPMPPRWAVRQLGLLLSKAWLFVDCGEVEAMPPDHRAALLAQGDLSCLSRGYVPSTSIADQITIASPASGNVDAGLLPAGRSAAHDHTWVRNVAGGGDHLWPCSVSRSVYMRACEALYLPSVLTREIKSSLSRRYNRVGATENVGFEGGWGLDDVNGLTLSPIEPPVDANFSAIAPTRHNTSKMWRIKESADEDSRDDEEGGAGL